MEDESRVALTCNLFIDVFLQTHSPLLTCFELFQCLLCLKKKWKVLREGALGALGGDPMHELAPKEVPSFWNF